jgi:adenylosuccinate synthase
MVVTKLDVMDDLDEIPVCVAYKIGGVTTDQMPATVRDLAKAEPVFETLKGWKSSTFGISDWDKLPKAAQDYVLFLENQTGVEAGCISTGPERTQTVCRPNSKFAEATS